MARLLPCLEDASPFQFSDTLAAVRTWLEGLTDSNPYTQIDWSMYQTIYGYCQRDDFRPIVEEVVKRRLKAQAPACEKALVIAQALPIESLVPVEDDLKPLAEPAKDNPLSHANAIAKSLLEQITKAKADKDEADEKAKWKAWCDKYGYPLGYHSMPPLPREMEWGMWGLMWVNPNEWWIKKEEKTDA